MEPQYLEVAAYMLPHVDDHEGKHSSHPFGKFSKTE
jgi:hypothetical protein